VWARLQVLRDIENRNTWTKEKRSFEAERRVVVEEVFPPFGQRKFGQYDCDSILEMEICLRRF